METTNFLVKNLSVQLTKVLIVLLTTFISLSSLANKNLSIVIFVNDSSLDEDYFSSLSELIYTKTKRKLNQFEIHHFTNSENKEFKTWGKGKRVVKYKPISKSCDFSLCSSIRSLVLNYGSTERLFYMNDGFSKCSYNDLYKFSTTRDNVLDAAYLNKIIEEHINKKSNDSKTLFILFNSQEEKNKLKIDDVPSLLEVKEGEALQISPVFSNDVKFVQWTGYNEIPCDDCAILEYVPSSNHSLTLTAWDRDRCHSVSKTIEVRINNTSSFISNVSKRTDLAKTSNKSSDNNCLCHSSGFLPIKDVFNTIKHPKYNNDIFKADWKILSRESGGFIFDFIIESSCTPKYLLEIYGEQNNLVWKEIYDLDEINKDSRNDLHKLYPDKFIFVLSLYDLQTKIISADVFSIKITPIDEEGNSCSTYMSPKLIFSKCP
jgi:hypothetical protein